MGPNKPQGAAVLIQSRSRSIRADVADVFATASIAITPLQGLV